MDAVRAQLASNLRRHRRKAGLTQERLAEVCDLHRTAIGLLERGKRSPLLETLVILARGLELSSPADLLEGISCAPADDGSTDDGSTDDVPAEDRSAHGRPADSGAADAGSVDA
jgi:transcriptional regulator with XRE-family HTH domain